MVKTARSTYLEVEKAKERFVRNLITGNTGAIKHDLETVVATGEKDVAKVKEAYKVLSLLADDGPTWDMLRHFPLDYFDAQARTEKFRLLGGISFDVVLTLFTMGVGAAVSVLAKSRYLIKAQKLIQDLAKRMSDVEAVARNSGLPPSEVSTLKKHLFFGHHEYPVDGTTVVRGRFTADHEIAFAWNSASRRELTTAQKRWFKQLADHELAERNHIPRCTISAP